MTHTNGFMEDKDKHIKASAKGGKKKGVLKGFAYMRAHNPEKYKQMLKQRELRRAEKIL